MAKVIITIEDGNQGELDAHIEFDPPGKKGEVATEAQKVGTFLYDVLHDLMDTEGEVTLVDADKPTDPNNPKPIA